VNENDACQNHERGANNQYTKKKKASTKKGEKPTSAAKYQKEHVHIYRHTHVDVEWEAECSADTRRKKGGKKMERDFLL
jgi:hypothetical protein